MWKKLDPLPGMPFEPVSNPPSPIPDEPLGQMLMAVVSGGANGKEQLAAVPTPEVGQDLQQLSTTTLREYAQTVEKCTNSASEFLRCASLVSEARESYEKLTRLSAKIRKLLDADELKLRTLMDQVQQTANIDLPSISGQSVSERRGPESSKAENVVSTGEKRKLTRFP
jgi:DNA repair exonuclease SbcCD ATPase subunit